MNNGADYKMDIIGNYITQKPQEYRVRTQDYERSRRIIGLDMMKVPAA